MFAVAGGGKAGLRAVVPPFVALLVWVPQGCAAALDAAGDEGAALFGWMQGAGGALLRD